MKKIYKICLVVLALDVLLYLFLFHSGIVLPWINLSAEEYSKNLTSFPRDFGQMMFWIVPHMPLSALFGYLGDSFLVLSVIQWPLVIFGVDKLIVRFKKRGQ